MYEPREDSFLLLKNLKKYLKKYIHKGDIVLDMGCGSGILARETARYARKVVAADIDKELITELERKNKNKKINFVFSDLFSHITDKFDLIIFNPPYLPSKNIKHQDIDGGKKGTEIIERFLKEAREHLKENGKILILVSSLNKNIEELFSSYGYSYKKIGEQKFFFEKLFVYELS